MNKHAGSIMLSVVLCILLFGQLIAAGHTHEQNLDASLDKDCAICWQASQNDDLDVSNITHTPDVEISNISLPEISMQQRVGVTFRANARAPPTS